MYLVGFCMNRRSSLQWPPIILDCYYNISKRDYQGTKVSRPAVVLLLHYSAAVNSPRKAKTRLGCL